MTSLIKSAVSPAPGARTASLPVLIALSGALLACCAQRDSITVGSVPDDYRTNHPIVVQESEETLDLPVGASYRGMTDAQKAALDGFLAEYERGSGSLVYVLVPAGSANELAAGRVADDFVHFMRRTGIPHDRIAVSSYAVESAEVSAPIRVSYAVMKATTGKCGRWPEDVLETTENRHYANFGCSYQNNLAAQISNPADLLGPRRRSEIDAEKRTRAIDRWRAAPPDLTSEITY